MDPFNDNPFPTLSRVESSSASDYSNNSTGDTGYSEGEVKLASRNPKKKAGRKKFKETRHPVYRGVRSRNNGTKWVCEVRHPNTQLRVWLGTHPTAEMAARAHDVAVLAMRGPSACLNFADSVWRLPVPVTNNVKDIQNAAAIAAEAFRPTNVVVLENKETKETPKSMSYMDEEELLIGMPGFFDSMAEALMVPPPQTMGYSNFVDNVEFCADMSLWSF